MDSKYPTLRRPQKKLCYLNKDSSSKQWTGKLSLQDVDKMFDDIDAGSDGDELQPTSPLLKTFDNTEKEEREALPVPQQSRRTVTHPERQMLSKGKLLHPEITPASPELGIDMDTPFKGHGPLKTSSPIEENKTAQETTASPILFDSEDDGKGPESPPRHVQKSQFNSDKTEGSGDSVLESPPNNFALRKSKIPSHNMKVDSSCKDNPPLRDKTPQKSQPPAVDSKREPAKEGNIDTPVSVRQEPPHTSPERESESVRRQPAEETCSHVGKDVTSFLQKLKDAWQPKPACSRKLLSPVKEPTPPPEPCDDFLIIEDEAPVWFSIPCKTATNKRQNKTSSTDKGSSSDKGTNESQPEMAQKTQEMDQTNGKPGRQTVNQKTKKKKGKGDDAHILATSTAQKETERMKVDRLGKDKDEHLLSSQEDSPVGDTMEQNKKNKTKQQKLKKMPPKAVDKAEDQPIDGSSRESDKEQFTEKKTFKSSQAKRLKSAKNNKENTKTNKAKSLKGRRERINKEIPKEQSQEQSSEGHGGTEDPCSSKSLKERRERINKESPKEQSQEQSSEEHGGTEDPCSSQQKAEEDFDPAKEVMTSEVQRKVTSNGNKKLNKLSGSGEGSSSEDSQLLAKRKRKRTGQWWLTSPQSTEETEVTCEQPILKKSRATRTKPRAASPSPATVKNVRDLKKNRKQSTSSPSQKAKHKAKEKKTQNRPKSADTPEKAKDKVFNAVVEEQTQDLEQQQVTDQDLDPMQQEQDLESRQCSPLVFPQRELTVDLGIRDQVFQRVYNHVPNETSRRSPLPHRGTQEQLNLSESEKRRRKTPGNWWKVDDASEHAEITSSQLQQLILKRSKPRKEGRTRSKQSRSPALGTLKNGNVAIPPKPLGGALEPPLKAKQFPAPKSVRRTLAMCNDIFASAAESPLAPNRGETSQNNKCNVSAVPVEDSVEVSPPFSVDAAESRIEQNRHSTPEAQQDSRRSSESTSTFLQSGPLYMIELDQHEENEDLGLPSSKVVRPVLSVSELCGPPLRPLVLKEKDKANLTEWLKSLWSATADGGSEITSDHFDWYFHQGRAIGFHQDLQSVSFCSGKILLGSYMKKPLWVDHSATTVFNVLTSSVSVTINGSESRYDPGQSFMVQCGHAYSIQNRMAQPAILYFNRMLAESSD